MILHRLIPVISAIILSACSLPLQAGEGDLQAGILKPSSEDSHLSVRTVEPFAPAHLLKHIGARDTTLRFDGKEAYFTSQSLWGEVSSIFCIRKVGDHWSTPEPVPFCSQAVDLEPFLSPDGLRLYFASNRSNPSGIEKNYDLWYVERKSLEDDWSTPANLGSPVNSAGNEFFPAVTAQGDLYFTSDGEDSMGKDDIFFCAFRDGAYEEPANLGENINTEGYEFNAYVSPDGSILLFTGYNREDGMGSGDLYRSQKDASGNWSPAMNLGPEINSDRMDYCPFIDAEGTLYFTSKRSSYSNQGGVILSENEWLQMILQPENGFSRIYQVKGFVPGAKSLASPVGDAKKNVDQHPESPSLLTMKSAQEIVKTREIAFAESFANRDLNSFLTFISSEAVFFAMHTPLRGKKTIANAWAPLIESEAAPFSWHPDVIEVLESGDLAISSGPIHDPNGKEVGRFNSIWRKEADGQWRVIFDKGS